MKAEKQCNDAQFVVVSRTSVPLDTDPCGYIPVLLLLTQPPSPGPWEPFSNPQHASS